ncbi:MAG: efflux RND transporter periplasmic adaptor subunit [Clostridium sp.]|nr:efflux RND transporter periplasmic adaptor subunit [Clostridium sp.]
MESETNMEHELIKEETEDMAVQKKSNKKNKKIIIIIVIVVAAVILLAVLLGSAMKNFSANMQEQMNGLLGDSEDIYTVERQDVKQEITTSGNVIGVETIAYTSPITAKVEDIRVEVGQTVKKGDVLLTYDASELGDNLEKVKIQAQSERAAGNESFEQANKAAGKASEAAKKVKSLKEDIKKLKKEIEKLNQTIEKYEDKMKAAESAQVMPSDTTAGGSGETAGDPESSETTEAKKEQNANSGLGLSASENKAYKKAVSDLQKKTESLAAKQTELVEQESIVAANEDVTVSESTKAQISATNQLSDMNINDAQESYDAAEAGLTARADGIVESIDVVKGAYANETQTLLTIIDGDQIGVEFTISKDDLGSISHGQKVRVVISGHEYSGTVDFVSRVATAGMESASSAGGNIKGRILLDNPDENIYIGISAKVYIFVGESGKALTVPYEALCSDIDGDYVYVVNGENLIERKDVTLGIYSDEYYEVLDGIAEGDRVIRNVTSGMKSGDAYVGGAAAMPGMAGME